MMKLPVFLFLALGLVLAISGCSTAQDPGAVSQFVTDPVEDSTIGTETLVIQGSYYTKDQFRVSNNPQDNCGAAHYHANIATSVCGEPKTDPSPESCGFGKVAEVQEKALTENEIQEICFDTTESLPVLELPEFSTGCKGGSEGERDELTAEDLKKYDKAHKEVKPLNQPQSTTCAPTSGAMDLIYWNQTLYPGLVTVDPESLIRDLAKRMETSGVGGTKDEKIVFGLADYLAEHAKGKFTVTYTFKFRKTLKPSVIDVKGTKATFLATDSITVGDIGAGMAKGNILGVFRIEGEEGSIRHVIKLVALDTKGFGGRYKVAFADPGNGKFIEAEMDYDGNMEIKGEAWKLQGIVSVTPKG